MDVRDGGDDNGPSLDKVLLEDESGLSLMDQLECLMQSSEVADVVEAALGLQEAVITVPLALACFLGRLAGAELSVLSSSRDEKKRNAGEWVLDGLAKSSDSKLEQFQDFDCPISKVFLVSAMSTRIKRRNTTNPKHGFMDKEARDVFDDDEKLQSRAAKLLTALSCIHGSQSRDVQVTGPASCAIWHGINLLLDMKGVSESMLRDLYEDGVMSSSKMLRKFMREAAASIDSEKIRLPAPRGMVASKANTGDNADIHVFSRVISLIPIGNVLLGNEDEEEARHLDANYVDGLQLPSDEDIKEILPTEKDDEVAKQTIMCQNAFALLTAATHANDTFLQDRKVAANAGSSLSEGDRINFRHRRAERTGKVVSVVGTDIRVTYREENGDQSNATISLKDISVEEEEAATSGTGSSSQD